MQLKLSHPEYRPDIDGLRALAVLAVVAYHGFPYSIKGGFVGVDVFFVISGYLISTILFKSFERDAFSFSEFYFRRINRIFPSLILVLVFCYVFGWLELLPDEFKQLGKHISAGAGFLSNYILWNESGYFDSSAETKPLLHLWSLGVEEQFYIIWPIILWAAWKRKINLILVTLCIGTISFCLNINNIKQDPVSTFYSPQTRIWELLTGTLLAGFSTYGQNILIGSEYIIKASGFIRNYYIFRIPSNIILAGAISIFGFVSLNICFFIIDKDVGFPGFWALFPVLSTVLIILAGKSSVVNRLVLSNKIFVWIGKISFPLYLWHWPLLSFAQIIESDVPSINIRLMLITFSIFLAWLTHKYLENKFLLSPPSIFRISILILVMSLVCFVGYNTYERDGLPFRLKGLTNNNLLIMRKGIDSSLEPMGWFRGNEDWLFLGDKYDKSLSKLKLTITPSDNDLEITKQKFQEIVNVGDKFNTKIVLFVAPNKSSVYSEFIPKKIVPSSQTYIKYFTDKLNEIKKLTVYNPTEYMIENKNTEGILYWKTDTHWNEKGAFVAYKGFAELIGIPLPQVNFTQSTRTHKGDLIEISNLIDFPLHVQDNWDVFFKDDIKLTIEEIQDEQKTSFGIAKVVYNKNPIVNKIVWVVGDSFTNSLMQYFNATFKEVRYVGHWSQKLSNLPNELHNAVIKPDMIVIIKVERSF